ncbi:MAG: Bax inhibitor-1/YccA family protein [Bacteroidales bacterium]|nr:Bax inhibitor-1/YccA family protein [Bacteroidales bacterium]
MDYKDFDRMVNEAEGRYMRSYAPSVSFPVLMRKVYTWMALAMVITGITAYGVASSPYFLELLFTNRMVFWGMIIAELALVFGISGMINRISLTAATLMFIAYSVINGATLSSIFLLYTMESIGSVFFITAGTFGAMALIGYTTKKDLTTMGKYLFMALIGLVIATFVNMFVGSSGLQMIVSYVGVLIFVGLTAYDSQKIKMMLMTRDSADEGAQKLALLGSLTLYLDFINLFLYLLRIFGGRRD